MSSSRLNGKQRRLIIRTCTILKVYTYEDVLDKLRGSPDRPTKKQLIAFLTRMVGVTIKEPGGNNVPTLYEYKE